MGRGWACPGSSSSNHNILWGLAFRAGAGDFQIALADPPVTHPQHGGCPPLASRAQPRV